MAAVSHGSSDAVLENIKSALDAFEELNPGAVATLYRQNSASIWIRVVYDKFAGVSKGDRHDQVWDFIASRLDDDSIQDISVLLLLTPKEVGSSFMNSAFDDPIPSEI